MIPEDLSADELELLELARTLTPEQRADFLLFMRRLVEGATPAEAIVGLKSLEGLEHLTRD